MWLLHTITHKLHEFHGEDIPEYAILSHTWGDEEISFRDLDERPSKARLKAGYDKILQTCQRAKTDGYEWAWIDTCCIDKRSSAELSEAINSMFRWYQFAKVCYVYLVDVSDTGYISDSAEVDDEFSRSRWFTRGWTLQELIAPLHAIVFFSSSWKVLATKAYDPSTEILNKLSNITGIQSAVLRDGFLGSFSVAQRMSWVARRCTTRDEDMAYCLMGLFGVHMPILYGEGSYKAFQRLQLEIIRTRPDESIFAWRTDSKVELKTSGLLAASPTCFKDCARVRQTSALSGDALRSYNMTNIGLSIEADLILSNLEHRSNRGAQVVIMPIGASIEQTDNQAAFKSIGLYMIRMFEEDMAERATYRRVFFDRFHTEDPGTFLLGRHREYSVLIHVLEDDQFKQLQWLDV